MSADMGETLWVAQKTYDMSLNGSKRSTSKNHTNSCNVEVVFYIIENIMFHVGTKLNGYISNNYIIYFQSVFTTLYIKQLYLSL